MIWPLGPDEFFRDHWEQRHFVSHGPPSRVEPIFQALGVRSTEAYLERRREPVQIWSQTREGDYITVRMEPPDALSLYRAGLTVYVSDVGQLEPWKAVLGRQLGYEQAGPASLFGARSGAETRWHFDRLENFTVQLSGTKTWRVAPNRHVVKPLHNWVTRQPILEEMRAYVTEVLPRGAPPGPTETFTLEPGSVLYLPRGYWHTVEATSGDSLSVIFLYAATTWVTRVIMALQYQLNALPAWREHTAEVLGDRRDDARARAKVGALLADLRALVNRLTPEDFVPDDVPPPPLTAGSRLSRNPLAFLTVEELDGGKAKVRISVRTANARSSELEIEAALIPVCLLVRRRADSFLASEAAAAAPKVPFARVADLLRVLWQAQALRRGA